MDSGLIFAWPVGAGQAVAPSARERNNRFRSRHLTGHWLACLRKDHLSDLVASAFLRTEDRWLVAQVVQELAQLELEQLARVQLELEQLARVQLEQALRERVEPG